MSIAEEVDQVIGDIPEVDPVAAPESETVNSGGGISFNLGWLKTPTGEGSIEDRLDHPLNPQRSMGVAQVLRGVEGFTDTLRLAILDIGLGAAEVIKERRGGE